ncbi:MAG: ThuA domain-containing protein [Anaerolineales bacterium]
MKRALLVQGGWEGHEPKHVSSILADALTRNGFEVVVSDSLDSFKDVEYLRTFDLIVPEWTMGKIERDQLEGLLAAIKGGVGLAGLHGGLGDSFREATDYQFMVGGQWVAHPGNDGITYEVNICDIDDPLVEGLHDMTIVSEQYYMHVDPSNKVLMTTTFHTENGDVVMPVAWKRYFGEGRVFYCSLGHVAQVFDQDPLVLEIMTRGMLWAARVTD